MRNKNSNGRKFDRKSKATKSMPKGRDVADQRNDARSNVRNDVSWYSRYPILLSTTGSFPYPYRAGDTVPAYNNPSINLKYATMGVLSLGWAPAIGHSTGPSDPASLLGKQMYDAVRSTFSGTIDADAPDFVTYMLCLDSIIAGIASLKRVYRIAKSYTPDSRVLPDTLLNALGFNGNDVRSNLVELLRVTNECIYKVQSFVVPAVVDYFNRHYWMNDNVYADAPSINSQLYVFRQMWMYQYQAQGASNLPTAHAVVLPSGNIMSYAKIISDAISSFMAWDDCYLISGYLKKAFEGVPSFSVDELQPGEVFTPVYEPEVLTQIENAFAVGAVPIYSTSGGYSYTTSWNLDVTQDPTTNAVLSDPKITFTLNANSNFFKKFEDVASLSPTFTCRSEVPTVAENVIMSRLKNYYRQITKSGNVMSCSIGCASEIVVDMKLFYPGVTSGDPVYSIFPFVNIFSNGAITSENSGMLVAYLQQSGYVNLLHQFDWHPLIINYPIDLVNSGYPVGAKMYLVGDIHNFTTITSQQLDKLHTVCLYSEFSSFNLH